MESKVKVLNKLYEIQQALKAPKENKSTFGKSRSADDILEALKPLLKKHKCIITMDETIKVFSQNIEKNIHKGLDRFGKDDITKTENIRHYIKCIITLYDIESGEFIKSQSMAREHFTKRANDDSQITGATISYARKYALGGLFAIDDEKDADSEDGKK